MIKRLLITIICCLVATTAIAVDGTTLDPSRTLYGARQLGLGGLAVTFSDDANGIFSNPSGLTDLTFPQLTAASRNVALDETQYSLLGWAMPTDWGTFGLGYVGMGISGSLPTKRDPATNRIMIDPSQEASSYSNSVLALSYSKRVRENLALGANYKIFNQALSGAVGSSGTGMGLDLGATYQANKWLQLGATLQNIIGGTINWSGGSNDKIGGFYKIGAGINILGSSSEALRTHEHKLKFGLDFDFPNNILAQNSGLFYHAGFEYSPHKNIALRSGFNQDMNGSGLNFGLGFINSGFRFDYAYAPRPGIPGDSPHYFSLTYVGDRILKVFQKLKDKRVSIVYKKPQDRLITGDIKVAISAEAYGLRVLDQRKVWEVVSISATEESKEITEREPLQLLYLNGQAIAQRGTIEALVDLKPGRNVINLTGFAQAEYIKAKISQEAISGSSEVKVLLFSPFKDTPMDYWALRPIALCETLGLVTGYPDEQFRPERGITRAELVTLLMRTIPTTQEVEDEFSLFTDVVNSHWAMKYINQASKLNIVTGYPDGTFKPKKVLTRAEGVTILTRYAGISLETETSSSLEAKTELPFADLYETFWANKYISTAKNAGLLKYLEQESAFDHSKPFTRAEACEVLYRTPQVQKKVDEFWEQGLVSASNN